MDPTPDQVAAGHAFYTRRSLAVYDLAILGYFSRLAWKCPARRILQHYDAHVTANHLDILHSLPGDMQSKAVVFDNLTAVAQPGTVVFGATLLHDGVERNWLARAVMDRNNAHGVFSNADDDLDGLRQVTSEHPEDPLIEVIGCVALFAGRMGEP